jgi:hypothetical protein
MISHWLLGSLRTLPFPAYSIKKCGSSPHGLRCFSSAVTEQVSPSPKCRAPSMGFRPQSRHRDQQIRRRRSQTPAYTLRPQGFSPSRRLLPAKNPCGLVSCHNHVRGSPFRGFPSRAAVITFRQLRTLMPLPEVAYQPESWRQRPPTRLQGLDPPVESVSSSTDVTPHRTPSPSWDFSLPRVFLPPALRRPEPPLPSMGLVAGPFMLTPATTLRSINPPADRLVSLETADPSEVLPPRLPPS